MTITLIGNECFICEKIMFFCLNLHVNTNLLFFTRASTHSEDTDGIEELVSSMHSVHAEAKAPLGIFNEHILFKYVYFAQKFIYTF